MKGGKIETAVWPQVWVMSTMCLLSSIIGLQAGFFGMSMPSLRNDDSIAATDADLGSIMSFTAMGNIFGTILSLLFQERLGYKKTIIIGALLSMAGYVISAQAASVDAVKLGMLLIGVTVGFSSTAGQMYTMEIPDSKHKEMFFASKGMCLNLSLIVAYVLGAVLSWKAALWVQAIVPTVLLLRMWRFPELPSWLVSRGKLNDAEEALLYFRKDAGNARKDLKEIVNAVKNRRGNNDEQGFITSIICIATTPKILGRAFLIWSIALSTACSGTAGMMIFGKDIYKTVTGGMFTGDAVTILMGIFRVLVSFASGIFLKLLERRSHLIISGFGMGFSTLLFAYCSLDSNLTNVSSGIFALLGYELFSRLGFFSAPYILASELFPLRVRSTVMSLTIGLNAAFYSIGTNIFVSLKSTVSLAALFGVHAIIAFTGTLILCIFLPETKGKSLAEIEEEFLQVSRKSK